MEVADGIGTNIGAGVAAKKQLEASKKEQKRLQEERERALWAIGQQNWQPELASSRIGPYQRSQSPVADAYISSLLTGDNADAVNPLQKSAPQQRQAAQQRFSQNYGGFDQLRQQQAAMRASTPWALEPMTAKVEPVDVSQEAHMSDVLGYLSPEEVKALQTAGFKFRDGAFSYKTSGKDAVKLVRRLRLDPRGADGQQALRGIARDLQSGRSAKDVLGDLRQQQAQMSREHGSVRSEIMGGGSLSPLVARLREQGA